MLDTAMKMPEQVRFLVEEMYRHIENQPGYLLETAGGPVGQTANVVIARLFGHDDQIDAEWRIKRAEPCLLLPKRPPRQALMVDPMDDLPPAHLLGKTKYDLQSNYSTYSVSAVSMDAEAIRWLGRPDPSTFQWTLLALRYRITS